MAKPTLALVTGCFDLLHYGHFKFLSFAASKADKLIVALENDNYLKTNKGPYRPLFTQKIRKYNLEQIKFVDQVVCIKNPTNYIKLLQKIRPNILIISSGDPKYKIKKQICQELKINLIVFPRLKQYSTSKIISSDIFESH